MGLAGRLVRLLAASTDNDAQNGPDLLSAIKFFHYSVLRQADGRHQEGVSWAGLSPARAAPVKHFVRHYCAGLSGR